MIIKKVLKWHEQAILYLIPTGLFLMIIFIIKENVVFAAFYNESKFVLDLIILPYFVIMCGETLAEQYFAGRKVKRKYKERLKSFNWVNVLILIVMFLVVLGIRLTWLNSTIPLFLFSFVYLFYRELILNSVYYGNDELVVGNIDYQIDESSTIEEMVGNQLMLKTGGQEYTLNCVFKTSKMSIIKKFSKLTN